MKKKIWLVVCAAIFFGLAASGYLIYSHHQDTRLDKFVAENEEKSKAFFEKLYFISNTEELEVVQKLIADNNLDGAVAIYLPFVKKDEKIRLSVEEVAKFVRESYHRALFAYDHDESWDYELTSKLFGVEVTQHCWPMGCAGFLKLGPRENDDVRGCTSGDKNLSEPELRRLPKISFRRFKAFICDEDKKK